MKLHPIKAAFFNRSRQFFKARIDKNANLLQVRRQMRSNPANLRHRYAPRTLGKHKSHRIRARLGRQQRIFKRSIRTDLSPT